LAKKGYCILLFVNSFYQLVIYMYFLGASATNGYEGLHGLDMRQLRKTLD